MKKRAILSVSILAWSTGLNAAELPKAYVCEFTDVTRVTIEHAKLAPWVTGKEKYSRTYTAIDLERGTAMAVGDTGVDENVYAERRGGPKIDFIEHSKSGNVFLTTITDPDENGKSVIVTSGHKVTGLSGLAFFVQNLGTCDAKF
ncbi:hypothetical protein [Mesorhizobium sp. SP-1A]|uniref:hypothetical protein n=1 Tax=Mesorhizobium sp. SP-1A TaxID=3077840 RepID=UPI0028F6ED6B|nr:hypothetical protein [Mesorhizobium sp. SP-1A]